MAKTSAVKNNETRALRRHGAVEIEIYMPDNQSMTIRIVKTSGRVTYLLRVLRNVRNYKKKR